ncbi:MAG: MATE family efflux transporter [Eubacteriales bacterium]|nr:MATE family efflux transporter [Eubacteriales bacterium]
MQKGEYLLAREKVGRAVGKLMLPAVLTSMISMIYNFTDTFFIGLLRDTEQLSALSLSMPLMWLYGTLPSLISAGMPQVISLKMGAGDRQGARRAASFGVFGTLLLSALVTPLGLVFLRPALGLMGAQGAVLEHATEYLKIILYGMVFSTGGAMLSVLRAQGKAQLAGIGSALGIVVNILLDPLFILGFDMGVTGAAAATVLASLSTCVYGAIAARREFSLREANPGRETAKKMMSLSLSSCATSVLESLIVAFSFALAAGYGNGVVAAVSVGSKLYTFLCSLVWAISFSLQPLVGYNYAARELPRLKRALGVSLLIGTGVCLAAAAVFLLLPEPYMRLFTEDATVIWAGTKMIRYFAIGAPLLALNMSCLMLLSATGKALRSLIAGVGRHIGILVPALFLLRHFFGMDGIILAYPVTDILSTVLALCLCAEQARSIFGAKKALA